MSAKAQILEAANMLSEFDDLSVYTAMNMLSPIIRTALVLSEGNRKGDHTLYLWDGKRRREAGSSGLEKEIIKCAQDLREHFQDRLNEVTGTDKSAEETRKTIRNQIRNISAFLNSDRRRSLESTIRTLKTEDSKEAGMDADFAKVNQQEGVYDLINHQVIPHDPRQRFTRIMPFAHDPEAKAPLFTAHLEYVLPDPKTREYFLQLVASSLLRARREERVWYLWGQTAQNGKSELMRMLLTTIGEYGTWLDARTFTSKRAGNSTQSDMLMAIGKCLAVVDEPAKDDMDASAMKNASNMADFVLRGLYKASKTERWTATCIMLCNSLPNIDAKDAGVARRPVIIPFKRQITREMMANDKRPAGYEVMKYGEYVGTVEAQGIYNILMAALKRYEANNFRLPEWSLEMHEATDQYIYKNNIVAKYVAEKYEKDETGIEIEIAADFHERFYEYCTKELGYTDKYLMKPESIREAMAALGYEYKYVCDKRTERDTKRCYIGLKRKLPDIPLLRSVIMTTKALSLENSKKGLPPVANLDDIVARQAAEKHDKKDVESAIRNLCQRGHLMQPANSPGCYQVAE